MYTITMSADKIKSIAKPILFNEKMVRAILEGRKTVTRRIANIPTDIRCNSWNEHEFVRDDSIGSSSPERKFTGFICKHCGYGVSFPHTKYPVGSSFLRPRYNTGDFLYVRETWNKKPEEIGGGYIYKATTEASELYAWKPSIHMPKDAARIFLRVTDVRLERLQDIMRDPPGPNNQIVKEGCKYGCDFIALWQNTIPEKQRPIYGWDANPWVWVYEFERVKKK